MITKAINIHQQLFDQGYAPRCLVTLDGGFVLTNQAFRKLFNLSGSHLELKDHNLFDVLAEATGVYREKIKKEQFFLSESSGPIEGKIILNQDDGNKIKLDYIQSRVELDEFPMLSFEWQDVTEKVESRKTLRSTYERLQLAASISNLGIWEYEFENKEWYLNEWMCALFNIPAHGKSDITESLISKIDTKDLERLTKQWIDVKDHGGSLNIEIKVTLSDSSLHYLHCMGRCLFDTRRQPWKFVGTIADITERKNESEQLILDRNRMSSLIDAQNSLLIRMNKKGVVTYSNIRFRAYFELETMCSESIWLSPFLHSDQRLLLHNALDTCFKTPGKSEILLLKLKNSKGENVIQEWELVGIENTKGETDEVQGIGRDVTEQMNMNSRVLQTKSNLESLINNFNKVSIWSIDLNYNLTTCNNNFKEEHFQYYGNKLDIGDNIIDALSSLPDVANYWKAQYEMALKGKQFELELEVAGNYFEVSFNPIYLAKDIIGVAIYGMDITDSKKAEHALRLSQERLHFAIEGNQYGVWDYDVVNDHLYLSDSCRAMLGLDENDIGTNLLVWAEVIHPDDLENVVEVRKNLLSGEIDGFRSEVRMKHKNGGYKWILDKGKTFEKDSEGKPTRVIGLFLDISKIKTDESKLKEYLQRLEKFAYITSHNLRLPVANILGLVNMINDNSYKTKEDLTVIRKIRSSTQQIDEVIKEMNDAISFTNQSVSKPQLISIKKIWFIDDDDINNLLSERLIGKYFPETKCRTFLDAEEALIELKKNSTLKPDAIFLDINMPRMNGWEFLEEFEKLKLPINVYMLTSSIDPRDQQKAHNYSFVKDFISKPLREERLRLIVE